MTPTLLTGGEAVAHAMRQIDPDVVPVYPITPQTPIIQGFAKFVADGRAHTEIINVESEHSAMSAAIGSALAGARTMTATSSQGLALMAEVVYIAASMRAPIVMALGNRALSGPINIHCDHSDSMLIRDSGVIQLFAENAQEAYDLTIMAPRIAEDADVLLPVLVCQDGFTITHSAEPVTLLPDDDRRGLRRRLPGSAPSARRRPAHDPGAVRHAGLLLRAAPPAGVRARGLVDGVRPDRRRVRGEVRPLLRGGRGVPARGRDRRDRRARLVGRDGEGGRRRPPRPGAARRPAQDPVVPAVPGTSRGTRVEWRRSGDRPRPCRFARRSATALRRGRRRDLRDAARLPGSVYGLGGRDLHPADIRELFSGLAAAYLGLRGEPCPV